MGKEVQCPVAPVRFTCLCFSSATNIIIEHDFSGGLHFWHATCCKAVVVSSGPAYGNRIRAHSGRFYAVVIGRTGCWQGLEHDITSRVSVGSSYTVSASVGDQVLFKMLPMSKF